MKKERLVADVLDEVCRHYRTFPKVLYSIHLLEHEFGCKFITQKSLVNLKEVEKRSTWYAYLTITPQAIFTDESGCESIETRELVRILSRFEQKQVSLIIWHSLNKIHTGGYDILVFDAPDKYYYSPIAEFGKKPEIKSVTLI